MARVSIVQRAKKREKLVARFSQKRSELKAIISSLKASDDEKWAAQVTLQKLPVNSSAVRQRNRCSVTGRANGVYSKFGLCRHKLREHAIVGDIPGLKKASW